MSLPAPPAAPPAAVPARELSVAAQSLLHGRPNLRTITETLHSIAEEDPAQYADSPNVVAVVVLHWHLYPEPAQVVALKLLQNWLDHSEDALQYFVAEPVIQNALAPFVITGKEEVLLEACQVLSRLASYPVANCVTTIQALQRRLYSFVELGYERMRSGTAIFDLAAVLNLYSTLVRRICPNRRMEWLQTEDTSEMPISMVSLTKLFTENLCNDNYISRRKARSARENYADVAVLVLECLGWHTTQRGPQVCDMWHHCVQPIVTVLGTAVIQKRAPRWYNYAVMRQVLWLVGAFCTIPDTIGFLQDTTFLPRGQDTIDFLLNMAPVHQVREQALHAVASILARANAAVLEKLWKRKALEGALLRAVRSESERVRLATVEAIQNVLALAQINKELEPAVYTILTTKDGMGDALLKLALDFPETAGIGQVIETLGLEATVDDDKDKENDNGRELTIPQAKRRRLSSSPRASMTPQKLCF